MYSKPIEKNLILLNGLKNNVGRLKSKGIDESLIVQLKTDIDLEQNYNKEYDRLRDEFKEKTIQANRKLIEIKIQVQALKKLIKTKFDKEEWPDFGVNDKR